MILQLIAWELIRFAAPIPAQWKPSDPDWDKAANEIRRLPPSTFSDLPAAIVEDLNRRRCAIPQDDGSPQPHNVVKGNFTGTGQIDWAVLCSRGGESSILVLKGQTIEGVFELANGPDMNWLQTVGEGRIGCSRMIPAANGEAILLYHREFGGLKPPPIDHQGIEDTSSKRPR